MLSPPNHDVKSQYLLYIVELSNPNSEWRESSWLSTDSEKSWRILNIGVTWASCCLFPEFWSSDHCCRIVFAELRVLHSCFYFSRKQQQSWHLQPYRAEISKWKNYLFSYILFPAIYFFLDKIKNCLNLWLIRSWLGLTVGSCNATTPFDLNVLY